MVENKSETLEDLINVLAKLDLGEKITDDEVMLLIRKGYFPTALEGVGIILKKIGLDDECDENSLENKLQYLPEEYLIILRRLICEVLKEGTVDLIKIIDGSRLKPKSEKLEMILKVVEGKLNLN